MYNHKILQEQSKWVAPLFVLAVICLLTAEMIYWGIIDRTYSDIVYAIGIFGIGFGLFLMFAKQNGVMKTWI